MSSWGAMHLAACRRLAEINLCKRDEIDAHKANEAVEVFAALMAA